jgi:outer membrane lipoprotein-sorting protein
MMKPLLAAIAAASFLTLGACTQDARVAEDESEAEQSAENLGNELEQAAENAGNELEQAGENAENAAERATDGNENTNP